MSMKRLNVKVIPVLLFGVFISLAACGSGSSSTDDGGGTGGGGTTGGDTVATAKATLYTTDVSGSYALTKSTADISTKSNMAPSTITVTPSTTYQTMDGFGAAITYSTAYNLLKMSQTDRTAFLKQTFSDTDGYGFSYVRVSIGCSDFSSTEYTCCDTKGIENFALTTDETKYVIPVLKEILAINPNLKIIGSPWTCPRWMKVADINTKAAYNSWTGGHLNPDYYQDYATYFVKWIKAFAAEGISIYAVTPQNEPLNAGNCASTYMPCAEEAPFVKVLASTIKSGGLTTKIYVYDHNYDYSSISSENDYPVKVYNSLGTFEGSEFVVGSAFHNYGGSNTELADIHSQAPTKGLIFSEASIGTWNDGRNLSARLISDMEELCLGTVNRYCTAVIVWNLMLDTKLGPNLDGGCQTCYGAVDIDASNYKTITKNSHYFVIGQMSSVVKPSAQRIATDATSYTASGLSYAAFKNTDGTYAVVLCNNNSASKTVVISDGTKHFSCPLPAYGIVSCKW
jgi:glucosylceramidase